MILERDKIDKRAYVRFEGNPKEEILDLGDPFEVLWIRVELNPVAYGLPRESDLYDDYYYLKEEIDDLTPIINDLNQGEFILGVRYMGALNAFILED